VTETRTWSLKCTCVTGRSTQRYQAPEKSGRFPRCASDDTLRMGEMEGEPEKLDRAQRVLDQRRKRANAASIFRNMNSITPLTRE